MNTHQTIAFGAAWALLCGLSVAALHALDATQEVALVVVLLLAVIGGTLLGVFGERSEDEREEHPRGTLPQSPHTP